MITRELEENINTVRLDARRRGLEQMTVEHLTLVLIKENTVVREMLVNCSADINGLKAKLKQFINSNVPTVRTYGEEPRPTSSFKRVLEKALVQGKDKREITGLHVLAAIFSEPESYAAYYMQKYGIERLSLLAQISQPRRPAVTKRTESDSNDLVAQAASGALEKPYGRYEEINLLIRTLCCKYKNNALLVGNPGVGKTAVVHALAHAVAAEQVPASMRSMRILAVGVAELVAGTKYRGDFEQRVQHLVEKCRSHGNTVVFIDEVHTLVGAGAVSGSSLDGANLLKPMLEERSVRYIGATTQTEYRRIFEKDRALSRRFTKIDIHEPDDATLTIIMQQVTSHLAEHHGVTYNEQAAEAAVEKSRRYLLSRYLPDKAITLLDEAGACRQLQDNQQPIDSDDIEQLARAAAGLPLLGEKEQHTRIQQLEERLAETVIAQDEAAHQLARAVICDRLDYQEENKTVGAFLFYGPTGVGKTEMAKQLAQQLGLPLLRYDMSEYMERHAVSRLIGAPPGYIGFEQSGKLIEDIVQYPASIILFDEVEKAHPDVLNIMLQILDYGILTDSSGRTTDFRGAMIIFTSNLGSSDIERGAAGFARDINDYNNESVQRFFSPEMRNRLDRMIRFQPLAPDTIAQIADKEIQAALRRLRLQKNIRVSISAALRQQLKKEGYHPTMGARPLKRLIKTLILEPLAIAEAAGDITAGGRYSLDKNGIRPQSPSRSRKTVAVGA